LKNRGSERDRNFFFEFRHFPVAFENGLGHIPPVAATQRPSATDYPRPSTMSGCSSGVEHNLAKVGVERSNRFTRSILSKVFEASVRWGFCVFGLASRTVGYVERFSARQVAG